ncbi:MAG: STAS domain-containing protein [Candidatus Delongbacteria bacterium]|nr:STAS domain-containing protein [Candidatus Delongbacteria bacterium]MBN2836742.1 STAS domain-containing protein [Candidatus Delongbacteria bacterium]
MEFNIKKEDGIVTVNINGNLVGNNNNELNSELQKLIEEDSIKIILNLKNVAQLDSYALGVLASSGSEIQNKGGDLKFAELQPFVSTLFKMMRMNDLFDIYETYEEALSAIKK